MIPNDGLNNGVEMPILGLGVYQIPPEETERAVATALEPEHMRRGEQLGTEAGEARHHAPRGPAGGFSSHAVARTQRAIASL